MDRASRHQGFTAWSVPGMAAAVLGAALACLPGSVQAQRIWGPSTVPLAHFAPSPINDWPGASYRAKDFTVAKVNGIYHLFYTRVQRYVPRHGGLGPSEELNETCFGHATSPDLEHWTELDTVLTITASSIERHHVWAPTLVQKGGVYWLFYTGVTDVIQSGTLSNWIPRYQFICAAISADPMLQSWTRLSTVLWQPCAGNGLPGVPWALCNPTQPGGTADFRDAFVLPPPAGSPSNAPWLMYYTAKPRTDQFNYLVGVAQSTHQGAAFTWTDGGALWDLYAPASNSKLESPHVFAHGNTWNLFVTGDDGTNGIERFTALWPASGPWEAKGSIIPQFTGKPDPPSSQTLDPQWWFASEYLGEDGPVDHADYFCFAHTYDVPASLNPPNTPANQVEPVTDIEFRRMLWNTDGWFDLSTPNPVRTMQISRATCTVGDTLTLTLGVQGGARQRGDFVLALESAGGEQVLAPGTMGLPVSTSLADGVVTVRWPIRAGTVALPANLVVRMGNQPLRLDTAIHIEAAPGGNDAGVPEMPVVRVRPPGSLAVETPDNGTASGGGIGAGNGGAGDGGAGGNQRGGGIPPALAGSGPTTLELRQVGSTPVSGGIGLLIGLPEGGRARLDVYDVLGRHVRTVTDDELPRGYTLESWDGRDGQGRSLRRGIYFVQLACPAGRVSTRLLLFD